MSIFLKLRLLNFEPENPIRRKLFHYLF